MKRHATATSRARRSCSAPVALFPFLAVLMCTMGALALLLVTVSRHSRLQAFTAARNAAAANSAAAENNLQDVKLERENVQWRISQLQMSRQQTESQLAEARLKLGHLEDHARRLRSQIDQLQASLAELEQSGAERSRQQAEADLERVKAQLVQAERQLADARRAAEGRPRSYAVIPYEGPNHTRRRPIYLECRANAVILWPEEIVFTADDFMGPLGPGNPLDVALRAMRECLLKARAAGDEAEEPYPLLLVRPDGIEAYYAARTAMASWGTEFGYELIGQDWKLEFPKANAQMADTVREVVASARVRQQQLIAAAPRKYGPPQSSAKYRAAPFRGGIIRDGGGDDSEAPSAYASWAASRRKGNSFGAGGNGSGTPSEGTGAGTSSGSPAGMTQGAAGVATQGATGSPGIADAGQTSQTPGAVVLPKDFVLGRPPREQEEFQQSPTADRVARAIRPGEWVETPPPPPKRPDEKQKEPPKNKPKVRSLAETRGRDWGLPDAARGSVGVTRSVRIDCHQDRLVIVVDANPAAAKTIPLGERTAASIDALISSVWEHMDSWGIAGKGMYWRPVLNFHVAPNGEGRFEELKALLDGSGLEVRRHEG